MPQTRSGKRYKQAVSAIDRLGGRNRNDKWFESALTPATSFHGDTLLTRAISSHDDALLTPATKGQDDTVSTPAISAHENRLWTKEQETALRDAYSTIKPSADFWQLISKRVPGRNATECFNKFYSAHPTPPRPAKRVHPTEIGPRSPKAKATRGKQQLVEAHRTVRNILRKQQVEDEGYEDDAFAALEHPDAIEKVLHGMNKDGDVILKENRKPSVGGRMGIARDAQAQECSPQVLKKVKDPVQLDKYIDHLHYRHVRRSRAGSSRKKSKKTLNLHCKNAVDMGETTSDAIQRAKQELRNVSLMSGCRDGNVCGDIVDKEDDESDGSQNDVY